MSEDSIFIVKVDSEQYLLHSKQKRLRKKKQRLYCLLFMYVCFGEEKKRQKIALI